MAEMEDTLAQVPLFSGVKPKELKKLSKRMTERELQRGRRDHPGGRERDRLLRDRGRQRDGQRRRRHRPHARPRRALRRDRPDRQRARARRRSSRAPTCAAAGCRPGSSGRSSRSTPRSPGRCSRRSSAACEAPRTPADGSAASRRQRRPEPLEGLLRLLALGRRRAASRCGPPGTGTPSPRRGLSTPAARPSSEACRPLARSRMPARIAILADAAARPRRWRRRRPRDRRGRTPRLGCRRRCAVHWLPVTGSDPIATASANRPGGSRGRCSNMKTPHLCSGSLWLRLSAMAPSSRRRPPHRPR